MLLYVHRDRRVCWGESPVPPPLSQLSSEVSGLLLQCCFTSSETVRAATSTLTQLLSSGSVIFFHCALRPQKPTWLIKDGGRMEWGMKSLVHHLFHFCFFIVALRPRKRDGLLGTGTGVGRGRQSEGSTAETARKRPERPWTVDRRQNNGSVKAVSPRHCPATCALRNCCFNCCAWTESLRQCPLHRC